MSISSVRRVARRASPTPDEIVDIQQSNHQMKPFIMVTMAQVLLGLNKPSLSGLGKFWQG